MELKGRGREERTEIDEMDRIIGDVELRGERNIGNLHRRNKSDRVKKILQVQNQRDVLGRKYQRRVRKNLMIWKKEEKET